MERVEFALQIHSEQRAFGSWRPRRPHVLAGVVGAKARQRRPSPRGGASQKSPKKTCREGDARVSTELERPVGVWETLMAAHTIPGGARGRGLFFSFCLCCALVTPSLAEKTPDGGPNSILI
jgi:hypothetical protein